MNRDLDRAVRARASERCEYCLLRQAAFPLRFQIDHILAEQHGGPTIAANLALACPHCNSHKGPNIASIDPASGQIVRLFHPRTDDWHTHFTLDSIRIVGITDVGRATVNALAMNEPDRLMIRRALIAEGMI